jgi:DNA-binding protein YbaB
MANMFEQIKQLTQMRREAKRVQSEINKITSTYTNGGITVSAKGDVEITGITIEDAALEELKAGKKARFQTMLQNVVNGAIKQCKQQIQEGIEKQLKSGGGIEELLKQLRG